MELLLNNSMRASDAYCVQADGISALFLAMTHEGALLLARNQPPLSAVHAVSYSLTLFTDTLPHSTPPHMVIDAEDD